MVNTVKFSQFATANLNDSSTQVVGLATGQNIRTPKVVSWTTGTRPVPPPAWVIGANSDLQQYEFWDPISSAWVQLASSVNLTATFILKTPDLTLPNSFPLSSLSTGILKNDTGTGVPTISAPLTSIDALVTAADEILYTTAPNTYAVTSLSPFSRGLLSDTTALQWRTDLGVPGLPVNVSSGGTGDTSFTPFSVICGGTTSTNPLQSVATVGVLGQVLTSNGPGSLPSWQNSASSGIVNPGLINELAYYAANGSAVSGLPTASNGVLVTDNSGVPSTSSTLPLAVQTNITELGTISIGVWNGSLIPLAFGGTNANLIASAGSIVYSTASAFALSAVGTSGQLLQSNGAGAPSWTTATFPGTVGALGTILRSDGTNWVASTAAFADSYAASNILYSNGANNVVGLATANNGVLITSGGGVPSISSTLPLAVQTNITELGTITLGTWNGSTITVPFGGTGDTSFTAFSVICAGTTATGNFQNVSGLGLSGQVLTSNGAGFLPTWQNAAGTGTVNSGTINDLAYYAASTNAVSPLPTGNNGVLVTSNSGAPSILAGSGTTGTVLQANSAAAPSWSTATYPSTAGTSGTILRSNGTNWVNSTSTFDDTYTANNLLYASGTNAVSGLATSASAVLTTVASVPTWAAQLSLALGGTNANLTADNGAIVYSTASALALLAHTTTAGLALLSGNNAAPTWSTSPPITKINTQTITTTGAGTYTPTAGTKFAIFELLAGGGGSGGTTGAFGQNAVGGGGGSGGYLKILATIANIGTSASISVGAAGNAGASGNNAGGNGGDTTVSINSSTWTAGHGVGGSGQAGAATTGAPSGTPGVGGTNTTGSNATLIANIPGQDGSTSVNSTTFGFPSKGGDTIYGHASGISGNAATGFGAGGSGQSNNTAANQAGLAGTQGIIIVTEFISV